MNIKKNIVAIFIGVGAVIIFALIGYLFYINSDTAKSNRQLESAQQYLLEEDYEQAISAFETIIEIDPVNVDAYLGLAEAYAAADDLENAVKILEKASKRVESEEILALLEKHTSALEQRMQAADSSRSEAEEATTDGETDVQSQQDATAEEMPTAEVQTCLEESDNDRWKQAYLDYLTLNNYYSGYRLIYIDNDDIPEMMVGNINSFERYAIAYYSNGTVYETSPHSSFSSYRYIERANLLCDSWGLAWEFNSSISGDTVYSIIDGDMTVIAEGFRYDYYDDDGNDDSYEITWNDRQVTEAEYDAELKKVFDFSKAVSAFDSINYTYDEIVNAITNFK